MPKEAVTVEWLEALYELLHEAWKIDHNEFLDEAIYKVVNAIRDAKAE